MSEPGDPRRLLTREWLVTNGLGGYAAGTVGGVATRRYHGLLTAALAAPLGRQMRLNHLAESILLPSGVAVAFGDVVAVRRPDQLRHLRYLLEFELEHGLPVWRYEIAGQRLEKRIVMPHMQNTVYVSYRVPAGAAPLRLVLRPCFHFRMNNAPVGALAGACYALTATSDRYEVSDGTGAPPMRLRLHAKDVTCAMAGATAEDAFYCVEERRGYEAAGELWTPGVFEIPVQPGEEVTVVASTEAWDMIDGLAPAEAFAAERRRRDTLLALAGPVARSERGAQLVLAADQFLVTPAGRVEETARARAVGDEIRAVIAGYHWFTDWGRDTMISLEGLTLVTGRHREAGEILRAFARYVRDGLIPNLFPEGEKHGRYHTADATLWYFHAIDRYVVATGDRRTLRDFVPRLLDIVQHHLHGTRFGIAVDPADGLLRQGQAGYQLTWMDAKVGDWVVTPRRGKAVEINALWYNALRLLEGWCRTANDHENADHLAEHAERARQSFNERFWYAGGGYLYDVVDGEAGDDDACRPNQLLALSLSHPVLVPDRWAPVLEVVHQRLLTPVGLRSLAPQHPDFKPRYDGDVRSRDAAYHQGTVWPWLLGPFVDAWLRVHPDDRDGARRFLEGVLGDLDASCLGTISEIFDAEPPFSPRGCVAQAWSVAEVLRSWVNTSTTGRHQNCETMSYAHRGDESHGVLQA